MDGLLGDGERLAGPGGGPGVAGADDQVLFKAIMATHVVRLLCLLAMIELRRGPGDFDASIEPSERLLDRLGIERAVGEHPAFVLLLTLTYSSYTSELWLRSTASTFAGRGKADRLIPLASAFIDSHGGVDGLLRVGTAAALGLARGFLVAGIQRIAGPEALGWLERSIEILTKVVDRLGGMPGACSRLPRAV
ncbi:MAG TPA: hypothetical protein VIJ61_10920, partial [Thermoanaerobaculia bacterium]